MDINKLLNKFLTLIVGDHDQVKLSLPSKSKSQEPRQLTDRDLLRMESKIGSTLFGQIPDGHRREFFCLDESTWIWHEEWVNDKGVEEQMTIRYESHPNGILKVTDGSRYQFINGEELSNLSEATRLYHEQVAKRIYRRDPKTGLKLA